MTNAAMREAFGHLRDGEEIGALGERPTRARRPTGSSA